MPQLEVEDITLRFGGVVALDDLSFRAEPDSITSLIGPNGAGKTTLFNVVTRLYEANSGSVRLDGQELLATPAHEIANLGIARTFQNLARQRDDRRALERRRRVRHLAVWPAVSRSGSGDQAAWL